MRVLGITDERTDCDCCGRRGLKCTVAIEQTDAEGNGTGDIVYYGRDCAAKAILGSNSRGNTSTIEKIAKGIEYARKWLGVTEKHTASIVANAIRCRFCRVHICGEFGLMFDNGVRIESQK